MDEEARMDLHGESNIICLIETKSGDEEVVMVETKSFKVAKTHTSTSFVQFQDADTSLHRGSLLA